MKRPLNASYSKPGGLLYAKVDKFSSSRVQIKDSGLTYGVDDETSPFLAVKISLRVH